MNKSTIPEKMESNDLSPKMESNDLSPEEEASILDQITIISNPESYDDTDEKATLILSNDSLTEMDDIITLEEDSFENVMCSTYQNFISKLTDFEIDTYTKYIIKKTRGYFASNEFPLKIKRINWWRGGSLNGIPYIIIGTRYYHCQFATTTYCKNLKKYNEVIKKENKLCKNSKKSPKSKKSGCPARFVAQRLMIFPELKMNNPSKDYKEYAKNVIKTRSEILNCEFRYICKLPSNENHRFHDLGPSVAENEALDIKVLQYIKLLVYKGKTDPDYICEAIEEFSKEKLKYKEGRRRFYPRRIDIINSVNRVKLKIRSSQFDQEREKIFSLKKNWGDESEIFTNLSKNDSFLFVYQNQEMRHLFRLYGSNCVLLDAVHRTCEYVWPLYFLVVNTNSNYQVVAFFITQYETKNMISEALGVIKSWNPNIYPKYFLVNRPFEDAKAIETFYPNIKLFISSYHRIILWKKNLALKENCETNSVETFNLLQSIANSKTESEMKVHIKTLYKSESLKNSKIKTYFHNYWRYHVKRWVAAYWPKDLYFDVNNGIKRLSNDIKYDYIAQSKCKSLTEIIETLIVDYIPQNLSTYREENLAMISKENVSTRTTLYFNGLAEWITDYILKVHFEAVEILNKSTIKRLSEMRFIVSFTLNKTFTYEIRIDPDSHLLFCTCSDYNRASVLCKHIIMVGLTYSEFHISKIVAKYFKNPVFHIDKSLSEQLTDSAACVSYFELNDHLGGEEEVQTENQIEITPTQDNLKSKCLSELKNLEAIISSLDDSNLNSLLSKLQKLRKKNSRLINLSKFGKASDVIEKSTITSEDEEME